MVILARTLEGVLRRTQRTFPVILVTGPRQSEKTTLLRHMYGRTHRFVSLENPSVRERARGDPEGFMRMNPSPVIFDEIQYAPDLLSYIKTEVDERRTPGRYLLTGSRQLALMQGVSQSLAGRVAVLTLLPFSVGEALGRPERERTIVEFPATSVKKGNGRHPGAPRTLGDWLLRGGFPEPRTRRGVDLVTWCASYVQSYLERDVRSLVNVGNLETFGRFLRLCAARTAQLLNLSDLARDTGVSVPTARAWLSVLEATHAVFLLTPYHRNPSKRLVKAPKLYFVDTALAAFLIGLRDERSLLEGPSAGPLFETAVVAGWRKAFLHRGDLSGLSFWRTRDGDEVDLIIEAGGRTWAIEIKATSTPLPRHAAPVRRWLDVRGGRDGQGFVVANISAPQALLPGVKAMPWHWV